MKEISERIERAEKSIQKKYHKQLFSPFAKACKIYKLIEEGNHIAVCISGGKDSMLMAKLFHEIQRHRHVEFEPTFLVMDPGYNKENRVLIEENAKALGILLTIFESTIFDTVDTIALWITTLDSRNRIHNLKIEAGCRTSKNLPFRAACFYQYLTE